MNLNKIHTYLFPFYFALGCYVLIRLITDTFAGESHLTASNSLTIVIEVGTCILSAYLISWVWKTVSVKAYKIENQVITRKLIFKNLAIFTGITFLLINATIIPMVALTDDGLSYADFILINSLTLLITVIWYFYYHTNYFMEAFAKRENDLINLEKQQTEDELSYLKGQVQPHFLFNALNTIYFQVDEKNQKAKETIEQLSGILRYGLYESSVEKVLLTQEIHFLEEYVALMQTRMGDQIDVKFVKEIDFPAKIAPQLFFPLVENAFKYVSEKEGTIFIFIKSESDRVICEVKNSFTKNKKNNFGGVGLANLKRRLELLYPQSFELSLDQDDVYYYAKISLRIQ